MDSKKRNRRAFLKSGAALAGLTAGGIRPAFGQSSAWMSAARYAAFDRGNSKVAPGIGAFRLVALSNTDHSMVYRRASWNP